MLEIYHFIWINLSSKNVQNLVHNLNTIVKKKKRIQLQDNDSKQDFIFSLILSQHSFMYTLNC